MDKIPTSKRSWPSLTSLAEGTEARLRDSAVSKADQALLTALGLVRDRRLLVRKIGAPFIIEVRGIRIGLAEPIAAGLKVEPLEPSPAGSAPRA